MIKHIKWLVFLLTMINLGAFVNFIKYPETQNSLNFIEMMQLNMKINHKLKIIFLKLCGKGMESKNQIF